MFMRTFRLAGFLGVVVGGVIFFAATEPVVAYDDKLGFLGMDGSPGEPEKCLEIYFENSQAAGAVFARIEFDTDVLAPVLYGSSQTVKFAVVGRAVGYIGNCGFATAMIPESGVLHVLFGPTLDPYCTIPTIPVGAGPIIKVYFDVLPTAPLGPAMFAPFNTPYYFNHYSNAEGTEAILVDLVKDDFNVVSLPYVPGDANGNGSAEVGDVVYINNYVLKSGPAPIPMNAGDPNGDCSINLADSYYLIDYIFHGGEAPLIGCAECSY
jgi:hypothetical protein